MVETESSAAPFHDWNERITEECYAANLAARILDDQGRIVSIVNNYNSMSFDFGPTLLSWLEEKQPEVYNGLINSNKNIDKSGEDHGTPLAQCYNHLIMPLANSRDKRTQIIWGIGDFHRRFGFNPGGMWLPETAVDLETLEILAANGIKYTVLAPHQAHRIKPPGGRWHELLNDIDTSRLYRCPLPSGKHINIALFHPQLSRDVAFGDVLKNGDVFTHRVLDSFQSTQGTPRLITIASDGETYGHHHRFGEMALAYTIDKLKHAGVRVTSIAEYLALYPPDYEVEIREDTAWSCEHGIERWRSGCCCATGLHPEWNQQWRTPLRQAMELLRDCLNPLYETEAAKLLSDPWAARDDYYRVIIDRKPQNGEAFIKKWAIRHLSENESSRAFKLMELQRALMACFTSCGWFFDDIGGLESVLVLKQAGRALDLATSLFGTSLEDTFLSILENASSNQRKFGNGRDIYIKHVQPLAVGFEKIAANFALARINASPRQTARFFNFRVKINDITHLGNALERQTIGNITVTSTTTGERNHFVFTSILTERLIQAGVKTFTTEIDYESLADKTARLFESNPDPAAILSFLSMEFPGHIYCLDDLSLDEQRQIIGKLITNYQAGAEQPFREIFSRSRSFMLTGANLGLTLPDSYFAAASIVLNSRLLSHLKTVLPNLPAIEAILEEFRVLNIKLDTSALAESLSKHVVTTLGREPDIQVLETMVTLLDIFQKSGVSPDLWRIQNRFNVLKDEIYPLMNNSLDSEGWITVFNRLAVSLNFLPYSE